MHRLGTGIHFRARLLLRCILDIPIELMAATNNYIAAQLLFVLIPGLFLTQVVIGQPTTKSSLKNELSITSINDSYVPPFGDRYFTNGINITFSRIIRGRFLWKTFIDGQPTKSIIRYGIAHEIYTPKNITEHNPIAFDRPYAGFLFSNFTVDTFWMSRHNLQLSLIVGLIGPKTRAGELQRWWHKLINYTQPEGWNNQIGNEPVVNFGFQYRRTLLLFQQIDMISTIGAEAGTGFNKLYTGATVRTGDFNPIDQSVVTASRLGDGAVSNDNGSEWFLFLGINHSFVLHNTLIEGNLFHPAKSGYIEQANFYLLALHTGFAYSTQIFTWKATLYRLSPEVADGDSHSYASLKMAVRF